MERGGFGFQAEIDLEPAGHRIAAIGLPPAALTGLPSESQQYLALVALAEAAELLVSELITNAVQASSDAAAGQPDAAAGQPGVASPDRVPTVRFWLAADRQQVLIQVWDGCRREPQLQDPAPEAESGRGLLLVEALSARWGSQVLNGRAGKVVWALVSRAG